MNKTLLAVVPVVIPVLTFVAALFGPALRTAARLRRDLTSDGGFVDKLPPAEKDKLSNDMGRRALILIGYSRYPALVLTDILALASSIGSGVYFGMLCVTFARHGWAGDDPMTTVLGWLMADGFAMAAFVTFHRRWAERAGRRIRHLESEVGWDHAIETARLARIAFFFSYLPGFVAVMVAPLGVALAIDAWYRLDARQGDPAWISVVIALVLGGLQARLFTHLCQTELDRVIRQVFNSTDKAKSPTKEVRPATAAEPAGDSPAGAGESKTS